MLVDRPDGRLAGAEHVVAGVLLGGERRGWCELAAAVARCGDGDAGTGASSPRAWPRFGIGRALQPLMRQREAGWGIRERLFDAD